MTTSTVVYSQSGVTIREGDCRTELSGLPDGSVNCCVTSPPYWGLRDYGTAEWDGGDADCDHLVRENPCIESSTLGGGKKTTGHQREGFKTDCPRCGATRIDQQLGLEATPEEYIAKMVAVFREVRRVLKDDGTLWVNIGDSFSSGWNGVGTGKQLTNVGSHIPARKAPPGLKPKDLVGIPWALAKAMRDPYYAGAIKDERDRIWLAAMIDAEGCIFIHKRKAGRDNGQGYKAKKDSYGAGLEVSNTNRAIVERCQQITGQGSICTQESGKFGRKQTLYRWNLRSNECREVLRELYPHFVAKQPEVRLAIGCPVDGEKAEESHASLKALHNGDAPSIDFQAPPTMFEPGWYLRSEIIWAKANCMPESVTDRPTKSHEQIFLFAKSQRYYYDADAIKEPAVREPHARQGIQKPGQTDGPMDRNGSSQYDQTEQERVFAPDGKRNKRSVWTVATKSYKAAHFATFPPKLIEPCILAGCPEGGTVLDPFGGSGTTAEVAKYNGRQAILIELNPEYIGMIRKRLQQETLFGATAEVIRCRQGCQGSGEATG